MTARTTALRLATAGVEMCRLTVQTPDRRFDVALPVASSIGELLPLVLDDAAVDVEQVSWVIQRLGGPPLDPGATPEGLGLHDGAMLYINPSVMPLPEAEFDDVSVGVAEVVSSRGDQWRPEFSRYLLLLAAMTAVAALCIIAARGRSHPAELVWCVAAEAGLTVWALHSNLFFADLVTALAAGLSACAVGAVTGFASANTSASMFTIDHRSLALVALCVFGPALVIAAAGRLPMAVFGAITVCAAAGAVGAALSTGFGWSAAQTVSLLAILVFACGPRGVRTGLRVAGLRAPLLPSTAAELQQDIDPEPRAGIAERSTRMVLFLNILFLTSAVLSGTACVLLSREPGWIGWVLALLLSAAVLLRSAAVTSAWQRAPLAVAGQIGLAAVVVSRTAGAGSPARNLALAGVLVAVAFLGSASRRIPGRRMLPVWGHLADQLETWTAVALVPLLLQLFHVYAHIRSLIH